MRNFINISVKIKVPTTILLIVIMSLSILQVNAQTPFYNVNSSMGIFVINQDENKLYMVKAGVAPPTIEACGQTFIYEAEGLRLLHYKLKPTKEHKTINVSACEKQDFPYSSEFIQLENEDSAENYFVKSQYISHNIQANFANRLKESRKYKLFDKDNDYGRLYPGTNLIYTHQNKYGKMVFTDPLKDVQALEDKKKADKEYAEWRVKQDAYEQAEMEKQLKEQEVQQQNESQETPK